MTPSLTYTELAWNEYLRQAYLRGCALVPAEIDKPRHLFTETDLEGPLASVISYTDTESNRATSNWLATAVKSLRFEGYFIPVSWMEESPDVRMNQLKKMEAHYRFFPLPEYLENVQRKDADLKNKSVQPGLVAVFEFFPSYLEAIKQAKNYDGIIGPLPARGLLRDRPKIEQVLEVFLAIARTLTGKDESYVEVTLKIAATDKDVQNFFQKHLKELREGVRRSQKVNRTFGYTKKLQKMEKDFLLLGMKDVEKFQLQEVMGGRWNDQLPKQVVETVNSLSGSARKESTVFERIAAYSQNAAPAAAPKKRVKKVTWQEVNTVSDADRKNLLKACKHLKFLRKAGRRRYAERLAKALGHLTGPLLNWKRRGSQAVPIWYAAAEPGLGVVYQEFKVTRERELREYKYLDRRLAKLAPVYRREGLREYQQLKPFVSPEVQDRWLKALDQKKKALMAIDNFRRDKLEEFGMNDFVGTSYIRDLYLDELIQIEKEITPFVPYVRQALQAVLPISNEVSFTSRRHSIDGPEFDPDTLTQPEKYLRGEVMQTFRDRKHPLPIAQVNAFCLDYSKSMTHEPMRNLFKLIFLLVLGLENRQTFDAIYFFGSDFFEVINFDEQYTSRKILWQILKTVSVASGTRVVYSGQGYTNLSAGIEKSCDRIKAFSEKLIAEEPESQIVKSLFVITDGEPTGGIINADHLHDLIEHRRNEDAIAIKGLYLNTGENTGSIIAHIFKPENTVETDNFDEAVVSFVRIMARTYKEQRQAHGMARRKPTTLNW